MPGPLIAPIPHLYTRWPPVAYQFVTSGSGAGIDFGSAAVLDNITVGKHTMAGWLAFDGSSLVGLNHNFWCKGGFASGLGWTVRMIADGLRLEHYTSSTTRRYDSSDTPLAVALNRRWMFLAVVADLSLGAGLKFKTYWAPHGEALKQGTTTVSNEGAGTSDTDAAQNLTLGVRDGGEIVAGWVHGPSAYWNDQVLGLADLQQWMLNPLALVGRPTVLAFPDPAADRFTDWSGNGQHATVSNGIFAGAPRWLAIDQGRRFWAVAVAVTAGVSGDGAGTIAVSGTADGTVAVQGAGAGTIAFAGSGSGTVPIAGTGAGSIVFSGSGTGTVVVQGDGTGTIVFSGTGTGGAAGISGDGAGVLAFSGSGAGSVVVAGAGAGTILLNGTATGTVAIAGAGAGVIVFTGSGAGGTGVASPTIRRTVAALQPSRVVASLEVSRTIVVEVT